MQFDYRLQGKKKLLYEMKKDYFFSDTSNIYNKIDNIANLNEVKELLKSLVKGIQIILANEDNK